MDASLKERVSFIKRRIDFAAQPIGLCWFTPARVAATRGRCASISENGAVYMRRPPETPPPRLEGRGWQDSEHWGVKPCGTN